MKNKIKQIVFVGLALLSIQSCAIFKMPQKQADTSLPSNYQHLEEDSLNAAKVKWKDFFDDPYLLSLIDSALLNNKELNITLQKINIANNEIMFRKGEYLPFVNGQIGADADKVGSFTRNGAVEENLDIAPGKKFPKLIGNYQFGLSVSWELDVWKKLRNAKNVAVLEYMATVEGKNFLVTNLVAEVANSYFELIALDNQLKNLEENIAIQQNALEMVKLLQQSARVNSLAVKRFEAEVLKNQGKIFNIKQEIVVAENKLNFLIGKTSQKIERNSDNFVNLQTKFVHQGIPAELLENRPDIRMSEQELLAAKLNIKVAKANFFPSLGIKTGVGYQAFNFKYLLNSPESILFNLAGDAVAPLFNLKALKAEYKTANSRQIQAAFDYEQSIVKAYLEVANQLSNVENIQRTFELQKQQVEILTESIGIANQLFQSARADYMEVLLTQRDALEAKMELIETKKNELTATVDLYKALGGGWQ